MDAMPRGLVLDTDLVTDALEHAHHVLGRAGGGQLLTRGGGKVNGVEDVRNSVVAEVAGCRERRHNASNGNVGRLRDPVARLRELFEEHRVDLANVLQSFPEPVDGHEDTSHQAHPTTSQRTRTERARQGEIRRQALARRTSRLSPTPHP